MAGAASGEGEAVHTADGFFPGQQRPMPPSGFAPARKLAKIAPPAGALALRPSSPPCTTPRPGAHASVAHADRRPASRSRARVAAAAAILPREGLAESGFIRCGEPRGDAKGEIRPAKSGGWLRDRDVPSRAAALPARA